MNWRFCFGWHTMNCYSLGYWSCQRTNPFLSLSLSIYVFYHIMNTLKAHSKHTRSTRRANTLEAHPDPYEKQSTHLPRSSRPIHSKCATRLHSCNERGSSIQRSKCMRPSSFDSDCWWARQVVSNKNLREASSFHENLQPLDFLRDY
jgi:hypothetical protein